MCLVIRLSFCLAYDIIALCDQAFAVWRIAAFYRKNLTCFVYATTVSLGLGWPLPVAMRLSRLLLI